MKPLHPDTAGLLEQVSALLAQPGAWVPDARGPGGRSWDLCGALHRVLVDGNFGLDAFGDAVYLLARVLRERGETTAYVMPALRRFNDECDSAQCVLELLTAARALIEVPR